VDAIVEGGAVANLKIGIAGAKLLPKTLQLMDKTIREDWTLLWNGFIRPTPVPGLSTVVVDRRFTLEGSTEDAFENSGVNAYAGAWTAYGSEPRYAKMKEKRGGGSKVLVWTGSKNPLRSAFRAGDSDHTEVVRGKSMLWGAKGRKGGIAARLAEGGFYQAWDKTSATPARPIIRITEQTAFEVARGMQRILRGRLGREGFRRARREP
jgi:phage gpG-like protein